MNIKLRGSVWDKLSKVDKSKESIPTNRMMIKNNNATTRSYTINRLVKHLLKITNPLVYQS
jgi:hypothetical protein